MKKFLLYIILSFQASVCFSQDIEFLVLAGTRENPDRAQLGNLIAIHSENPFFLSQEDSFKILLHKSGKLVLLRQKSKYSSKELYEMAMQSTDSVLSHDTLFRFLTTRISYNGLRKTGFVPCPPIEPDIFKGFDRDYIRGKKYLYGDSLFFCWDFRTDKPFNQEQYHFQLSNLMSDVLFDSMTIHQSISLSTSQFEDAILLNNAMIAVVSNQEGKSSTKHVIVMLQENEKKSIKDWLSKVGEQNHLAHALYFESKGLTIDAYFAYQQYWIETPDSEIAHLLFEAFMNRYYHY